MNIPEEFGNYLLLKKLTEDALGETFRAGKVGAAGMEQVVLLRVLNGKGMDGERLWRQVSGRAGVQQTLRSPNIGSGVDLGRVRSFPYVAYDYISGKNLATLLAEAGRQGSPIPTDHALLIAERAALALAVATESKVDDQRVLHGFVVPHLVMISNEGETRLLGFEVGTGLRDLAAAGWHDPGLLPYLAPEALEGAPLAKADDAWSLGALLFELLTGDRLPPQPEGGYAAAIDQASLANEGTPIPPALAGLLKKSLAPRDQRIGDAGTWHKTIAKLMIDGHFQPTTFNLAFFMHNLFRDEIEREGQEMQAEKRLELRAPAAVVAPAAAALPAPGPREAPAAREPTWHGVQAPAPAPATAGAPNRTPLFLGLAAVLVLALAGGGYFLFGRGKGAKPAPAPEPAMTSELAAAPPPVPLTSGAPDAAEAAADPEQLQAQISQMFDARSKEMEAKLKQQYDDRIRQLQQQLEESKRAGGDAPKPSAPASEPASAPAEPKPPRPVEAASQPATQPASSAPAPATNVAAASPEPALARPAPETQDPEPAPAAPRTQVGDLVRPGPGVVAPKLVSLPDPRYPPAVRRMNKTAQVDVKVLVDEKGRVLEAERVGAKAGFGFDEAALEVARRATYRPATKDGTKVKMWATLRVAFKP